MMRFLGLNARHHSLGLAPMVSQAGIIHLMIEVETLDDVGRAMDRVARSGGLLVDDRTWITRQTTAVSLWGHSFSG